MAEWCWMEMWNNQLNLASYITRLKYSANLEDSYTTIKKELLYENEDEFRTLYQSISSIQSYNNSEGTMMELNFLEKNENIMKKIINETFNEIQMLESNTSINISHYKEMFDKLIDRERSYIDNVSLTYLYSIISDQNYHNLILI